MEEQRMNIAYKNVNDLIPYINNPRDNDAAVDAVASSIKNFGFKVPIVVDSDNEIIAGHTRLKAAQKLGLQEVPTIVAEDLTENQVRAFRLADNKVSELAEWDQELLDNELQDIDGIDMAEFGFDLLPDLEVEGVDEDDWDEELDDEPARSKPGDIYQLGEHRVMCGDSTDPEDVKKLTDGKQVDLIVTDPPYNVAYVGKTADALTIDNDEMDEGNFELFLTDAFTAMVEVLKPGGAFYIWHAESTAHQFIKALEAADLTFRQKLIWVKNTMVLGRQDYHWKHEPCFYGWKDGAAHYFTSDRTQVTVIEDKPNINTMNKDQLVQYAKDLQILLDGGSTILREDKPAASTFHPTMKPVKLIARNIVNSSKRGEIVLDIFGGSGSTLIASEQLKRTSYTMELDPKYVDVIIDRYEEFTGVEAVLVHEEQR